MTFALSFSGIADGRVIGGGGVYGRGLARLAAAVSGIAARKAR
jgi:hypothetical protein